MAKKTKTVKLRSNDRYDPHCLDMIDSMCSGYMLTENPLEKEIRKPLPSKTTGCKQMQWDMNSINTSTDNIEVMADNTMADDEYLDNNYHSVWSTQTNKGDVVCIGCTVIIVILLLSLILFLRITFG